MPLQFLGKDLSRSVEHWQYIIYFKRINKQTKISFRKVVLLGKCHVLAQPSLAFKGHCKYDQGKPWLNNIKKNNMSHVYCSVGQCSARHHWTKFHCNAMNCNTLKNQYHYHILRFILPCQSECQPIFQNSIQMFQIKFLFLVQSFQKHIALVYFHQLGPTGPSWS